MARKMLLAYVAGPYTADTLDGIEENCHRARLVGKELARCGSNVFPVVPHQTGRDMEDIGDYEYWCEATLELMRRCDVVYAMQGWEGSKGARGEIAEANKLGIPVIYHDLALFTEGVKTRVTPCPR